MLRICRVWGMHGAAADMGPLDADLLRGLILISMLIGFLGIWRWAWSRERKPGFRDASMLPLEDDETVAPAARSSYTGSGE